MIRNAILITVFFLFAQNVLGQKQSTLHDSISVFFDEIKRASEKSTGLWDKGLYGPMILIDPQTRELFANESDTTGILKLNGNIYSGVLPGNINIANTAINWNGKRWAMIMLPLPQNKQDRINLLAHESFHRIQPSLGFTLSNVENNHLDQKDGRVYLRLELEAVKKAIESSSEKELQQHLTNALTFRKYRHALYSKSDSTENILELNEGIAEFTGVIVSGRNKAQTTTFFLNGIDGFFRNPTFVRSFAYYTTPVYFYLLYNKNKARAKKITAETDLTAYLIRAFNVNIPTDLKTTVENISINYNGEVIIEQEKEREEKTRQLIAEYRLKFIDQPHFEIKFEKMNVSFDPRNIIPIEDKGTVYPNIRVTDLWGILTVENGALMSSNWDKISISNPARTEDKKIFGDGWILELTDGYTIEKDGASGNYKLKRIDR
ncbi:hypothetical protein [Pedobacter antarcticus]|uniref:hypothetical protein n=1 Tax=Pedobacter antarcticus TaxID=34086 RepID=UPI0008803B05|nr:hypothetical protein [Pedobacter antarcticus]SDM50722.1 hypothetical protein SAMN04488084_107181 [Pedobacter antarcticus]